MPLKAYELVHLFRWRFWPFGKWWVKQWGRELNIKYWFYHNTLTELKKDPFKSRNFALWKRFGNWIEKGLFLDCIKTVLFHFQFIQFYYMKKIVRVHVAPKVNLRNVCNSQGDPLRPDICICMRFTLAQEGGYCLLKKDLILIRFWL